ncbi:MAG TPA: SRPBCC domain-containing protein [Streptosporangiaceae bacterium]
MTESVSYELDIDRIIDAPCELVYRAFTDPGELAQWFGPTGWHVEPNSVEIDLRPGGKQRFVMVNGEDPSFVSAVDAEYVEVIENELLVGTEAVDHAAGYTGPSGTLTLRLEFRPEGRNRTRLVIRQGPFTMDMEEQARRGWDSSFTKLDDLLAAQRRGRVR